MQLEEVGRRLDARQALQRGGRAFERLAGIVRGALAEGLEALGCDLARLDQGFDVALVEFVDVQERWLGGSLRPELIERTGHTEVKLHPFYEHLEVQHSRLRHALSNG